MNESSYSRVERLDGESALQWRSLAGRTMAANVVGRGCDVNDDLEGAAVGEAGSPAAPAFRLWAADNLARAGRFVEALHRYDAAAEMAASSTRLSAMVDPIACSLLHKAQAARVGDDPITSIAAYRELAAVSDDPRRGWFHAGAIAESNADDDLASELYALAASGTPSPRTDDSGQLARRGVLRLREEDTHYERSVDALASRLREAIEAPDPATLERLASRTHFAVGPLGGHTRFEERVMLERLVRDLLTGSVTVHGRLAGSGGKRYLSTSGWKGEWYRGDLALLLTRAPKGWQWTGVAIGDPHEAWVERWRPASRQTNQPLPFSLLAPWPAGQSFTAGGLTGFVAQQAAILAAGPLGPVLLARFASSPCGFGPRGFYYNQGSTHDEEDAFAIDFTRYRRYVPYDPESGGTPVLAVRDGLVVRADAGTPSGDSSASNTVEITHADPNNPTDDDRFRSRYLHLAGPFRLTVSVMMPVIAGQRLGVMDDTGNSVLDHLHFSIHDRQLAHPNASFGRSVRPSPMSGTTLGDGDGGSCVRSSNTERFPGLHLIPAAVTFGSVSVGSSAMRRVVAKNNAGGPVTMSVAASPPNAIFRWSAFSATVDDGEETSFELRFHPVDNAIRTGTLVVTSTAPNSPHRVGLTGKGPGGIPTDPQDPPLPTRLQLRPSVITFGSVALGSTATRTLTLRNETGASVTFSIAAPTSASPITWAASSGTIAHNAERTVTLTFRPVARVITTTTLTVVSSTVASPETVSVVGKGGVGGF
ncbi:MAG: choice-of-anchor D domain-containing protein [Actinomycetes bacterium]